MTTPAEADRDAIRTALLKLGKTLFFRKGGDGGIYEFDDAAVADYYIPRCLPSNLGSAEFRAFLGVKYAYLGGSMANGISSARLALELGRAGMCGFFGSAGLSPAETDRAAQELSEKAKGLPYGFNLINNMQDPRWEEELVDLFLSRGIKLAEASAYITLSPALVRFRTAGIARAADGSITVPNKVLGKVSRVEVAERFFSPPPEKILAALAARGVLTAEQAELAAKIPMADGVTAEADSGGHTDNRPALSLFPSIAAVRTRMQARYNYARPLFVGLGGGIATPDAAAAAFAMGADYVMAGSVHQACVESGASDPVREMLSRAGQADVSMAPAADMFEMGGRVQVLKRETMFPMRAAKLYELYKTYPSLEALPAEHRQWLERDVLRDSVDAVWNSTCEYFRVRDPHELERAQAEPKHKMALVFRWYLGQSSRWPLKPVLERKTDFQVWCGPALGAFNEWAKGSFLEKPQGRHAATVARNLLCGASYFLRLNSL
ncbi:MAG: PfaD family polyunsaturated fatty acid/polyketide biosynthesis protein, partial [Elusimicrobia bacterium]|nr:PfaD family polyunsaturated fatty acid/polyketide biosynthesis protein [Elusimicrobiota bacterium]